MDNERILAYLARLTVHSPATQVALGYLLAEPGRVVFVHQIREDRTLAMAIGAHRRIEIPVAPWQGFIRGVPVPDPITWIQAARGYAGQAVAVRVSTDDPLLLQMLAPLVAEDRAQEERMRLEERIQRLRQDVDQALDIYNEVRQLMDLTPERQEELARFLNLAQSEMQRLGQELKALKARLDQTSQS
ncbi:MAG: hypothetical protein K6U87_08665 [Firmicutes bacterium]|nr:hypothetical protein [Bacillota bacterium]